MEAKWPFILILLFFLGLTGYLISHLERSKVVKNWDKRRCDLTVMIASRFFKPQEDLRSESEFASDNFDFCIKNYSQGFLAIFMGPITWLMGKQADMTGAAVTAMNQMRMIMNRVRDAFMSYISSFTEKLSRSMKDLRRIFIHLRMGVQRMMAIAMSTIYMGMTVFRGMINAIQAVIRVVLIICAIMLVVIIILWFILLPIIPFILTTLTAVVALVAALSVVMSGSMATQAQNQKGGFCFSENTMIWINRKGKEQQIPISKIELGDDILNPFTKEVHGVTMIMEVVNKNVSWYELGGIFVSGDHRVRDETGRWVLVREDVRAIPHDSCDTHRIYCLNTTSRQIPIEGTDKVLYLFRDWEELEEKDEEGHRIWREEVMKRLNPWEEVKKEDVEKEQEIPCLSGEMEVNTVNGWRSIKEMKVGDVILGRNGSIQSILGIVHMVRMSDIHIEKNNQWMIGGYIWDTANDRWYPWSDDMTGEASSEVAVDGWNIVTDSGELYVRGMGKEMWIRDFTEVGYEEIKDMYGLVSERLMKV